MLKEEDKHRLTINVDINEDRPKYNKILKSKLPFKNNLELFTMAVLVGKSVLNDSPKPINKSVSYIRVNDNASYSDMVILKSLAISDKDDVKIINDENEMYKIIENYARIGIDKLYEWFEDTDIPFETKLGKILIKADKENKKIQEENEED